MVAVNQIRDEYRLEAVSSGVDKTVADGARLERQTEALIVADEKRERRTLSVAKAVESFAARNDALFRAQQQVNRGQDLLNRAMEQGLAETEAYQRATAALADKEAQLARITAQATAANDNHTASLARMRAQFDPVFAAQKRHQEALVGIAEAEQAGAISTNMAADARRRAASALNDTIQKLERLAQVQKAAAQAQVNRQTVVPDRGADIAAYGAELDRLRAKFDPLFAAQQRYRAVLAELRESLAVGAITQGAYRAELDRQKASFAEQVRGLGNLSAAEREAAAAAKASADALTAQAAAAQKTRGQWAALSAQGSAQEKAFQGNEKIAAQFRAMSAQGAAQASALKAVEAAQTGNTRATALHAAAWQNLGFQVNDVVTSLASGASPMMVLAQQGGQVYQVLSSAQGGVAGALGAIKDRLLAIQPAVGVFGLLAAAYATAGALALRYVEQQRQVEISLLGVGRASGATAAQIERIADEQASAAGISIAAAKEVAEAFASTGKIQVAAFAPGIAVIKDYAAATRQEIPAAAADLARSLGSLASGGLQEIQDKTFAFDGKVTDLVRSLLQQGRTLEAQQTVLRALSDGLDDAGRKAEKYGGVWSSIARTISDAATLAAQKMRDLSFPDESGVLRNLEVQRSRRQTVGLDTSDVDAKIEGVKRGLAEVDRKASETATKTRQNVEATSQAAAKAVIPEIESLEKLNALREQANKTLNAREAQGDTASQEYQNARRALEAATKAAKDYEAAGGAAAMAVYKRKQVEEAEAQVLAAKTPIDRANAARDVERAQQIGALIEKQDRYQRQNEASNKVLREARQASEDQSRAQNEATRTANDLATANTATSKSVEYLTAARKVDEQITAGTIDKADRELKIREQLQSQLATLNQRQAERVRQVRDGAGAQEDLNAKVAAGTIVSAEAQRRLSVEVELRNLARERDAASGEAKAELARRYDELKTAQEAQMSAEDRARVLSLSEDEDRRIAALQKEAQLLGLTTRERQAALIVLQAEQDLKRQGISTTSPESVAYLDKVRLRADMETAKGEYERLAQDISSAVSGIFDDMFKSGNKGLAGLADSFSRGFARIGTRMIEQNLIGPLLGGSGGAGGDPLGSLAKLFGFDAGGVQKAVQRGAESGVGAGIADAAKPQGGGATGGFASSKLGQGLISAGSGAAIGYQSQSPLMGAFGGALAGFSVGGPIGGLIGAGAGLLGGLFGQSEARKQRQKQIQDQLKQYKEQYENQKAQIDQFRAGLRGEAVGGVEGTIQAAFGQMISANKIASQGGDQAAADKMVEEFKAYEARLRAQVRAALAGTLDEVSKGFGTSGPFATAAAQIHTLGETMRNWLNDVNAATGSFSGEALDAIYRGMLDTLQPTPQMTETAKEFARIQGTAAGLQQELVRLNGSAEGAAAAIRDGVTRALDTLRDKFNADLDRKINEAQGKDYLNDVADLIKEVSTLRIDAASVGGDMNKVNTYFGSAAQKIVDESELTGEAFNALVSQFPQLTGLVHAYTAAITDQAAAMDAARERSQGFLDRLFAATNDTSSLSGQLAAFDRTATKERADEAKAGGQAMVDLEAALAAERLNIVAQYEAAVRQRVAGFEDRIFAADNDEGGLAGRLAAFDRKAAQERAAEVAAGSEALVQLEAAQAAERLNIVAQYEAAVRQRVAGFEDRIFAADNDEGGLAGRLAAFDRKAAQERADEAKAGGQAMVDLEAALAAERLNIVAQYEAAVRQRVAGFEDRIFAADNDEGGLAGRLAAFDRKAAQERAAEVAAGGEALVQLEAAQAAERNKVVRDFNAQQLAEQVQAGQQALDAMRSNYRQQVTDAQQNLQQAYTTQAQTIQTAIDRLTQFGKTIRQFRDGLLLGTGTTLSPYQQFVEAQRQFRDVAGRAQAGDTDAQDQLQGISQSYLDAAKAYYASSTDYARAFDEVQDVLGAVAESADAQATAQARQLTLLQQQVSRLISIDTGVDSVEAAIEKLTAATAMYAANRDYGLDPTRNRAIVSQLAGQGINYLGGFGSGEFGSFLSTLNGSQRAIADQVVANTASLARNWGARPVANQNIVRDLNAIGLQYLGGFGSGQFQAWKTGLAQAQQATVDSVVQRYASMNYRLGGVVGNGRFDVDSVLARYAGGGYIGLAGGEFVMPAPQVQANLPALEAMRAGVPAPSNDDDAADEVRQLRAEVRRLGAIVAASGERTAAAVEQGTAQTAEMAAALKRVASR